MEKSPRKTSLRRLAEFVCNVNLENLPSATIDKSKLLLIDNIGTILLGAQHPKSSLATEIAQRFSSNPDASILAKNLKSSTNMAAFANACFAQIYDFNDGHRLAAKYGSTPHPGRLVVPTALAEAEYCKVSGTRLLTALIIGYEIAIKVRAEGDKWVGSVLAATSIAAHIRGFTQAQVLTALSIAYSTCPQREKLRKMPASLQHSFLARCGIEAAVFSEYGMNGPRQKGEVLISRKFPRLGAEGLFELSNVYIKPYCSCRMTHSVIQAIIYIKNTHNISPEEVDKIIIRQITQGMYVAKKKAIENLSFTSAQLNLYYCAASAFVNGKLTAAAFTDASMQESRVADLYDRIEIIEDPELSKLYPHKGRPATVDVHLKNGKVYSSKINSPKGGPETPLSRQDVIDKFRENLKDLLPDEQIEKIENMCLYIEKVTDSSVLIQALSPPV